MSRASSSARSITDRRLLRQIVLRELRRLDEHGLGHVGAGAQLAANRPAQIVDEHEVIPHAARRRRA